MSGKFDLVVCMLGTLSHMLTNSQAAAAFRAAAQHLRPGGLLLLELAHPGVCVGGGWVGGSGGGCLCAGGLRGAGEGFRGGLHGVRKAWVQ
jgi:SAM-dependent methyltransferase